MKLCIAGSREFNDYDLLCKALKIHGEFITEVVSGTARGADRLGERYAQEHDIPIKRFPADWNRYGRRAGMIRNTEMYNYSDYVVTFWDGKSPGTKMMYHASQLAGKLLFCVIYPEKKIVYLDEYGHYKEGTIE